MKFNNLDDNICAISSGNTYSAIGIIRISGKNLLNLINKIFKIKNNKIISRKAYCGKLVYKNKIVDEIVLIYYKKPKSYTGQDLIEINAHGNPIILNKIIKILIELGCRLANPGEFTYRALMNNKMDLLQAEAVNEIVSANNYYTIQNAFNVLKGDLKTQFMNLKNQLFSLLSLYETTIDFTDQDIDFSFKKDFKHKLNNIEKIVDKLLIISEQNNLIKKGFYISVVGKPNVGKSSIVNKILNDDRAIVTNIPGTTTDIISENIILNNINVKIFDTAGIHKSKNKIEEIGIKKTLDIINESDIILFVIDNSRKINKDDISVFNKIKHKNYILLINKIDKGAAPHKFGRDDLYKDKGAAPLKFGRDDLYKDKGAAPHKSGRDDLYKDKGAAPHKFGRDDLYKDKGAAPLKIIEVSAKKNININQIINLIKQWINKKTKKYNDLNLYINQRHYQILKQIKSELNNLKTDFNTDLPPEIISFSINECLQKIGELTGEITTEDVLSNIFSNFCIGK